jgi:hypothetical protein
MSGDQLLDEVDLTILSLFLVLQILSSINMTNLLMYQLLQIQLPIRNTNTMKGCNERRKRMRNRKRSRKSFKLLLLCDEEEFQRTFRLTRGSFCAIVAYVKGAGFYRRYFSRAPRSVSCSMALGMTLLYLGNGCNYRMVSAATGCATCTVGKHIREMLNILSNQIFSQVVRMPVSAEAKATIAADFMNRCYIPNVIGAIDGTHIPMSRPSQSHIDFINRKSFHSMVFQGVAIGSTLQFIEFSGGWAGSVGDSVMFKQSELYKQFTSGLYGQYRLLADAAYGLQQWCLVPYERVNNLTDSQAKYNFWQSSGRMVIERAFGVLKGRFPILCRPFTYKEDVLVDVVKACVALHNICCVTTSEWDAQKYVQLAESWSRPPGATEYNFDNAEYERAVTRPRPTAEATRLRNLVAESLPDIP